LRRKRRRRRRRRTLEDSCMFRVSRLQNHQNNTCTITELPP